MDFFKKNLVQALLIAKQTFIMNFPPKSILIVAIYLKAGSKYHNKIKIHSYIPIDFHDIAMDVFLCISD